MNRLFIFPGAGLLFMDGVYFIARIKPDGAYDFICLENLRPTPGPFSNCYTFMYRSEAKRFALEFIGNNPGNSLQEKLDEQAEELLKHWKNTAKQHLLSFNAAIEYKPTTEPIRSMEL